MGIVYEIRINGNWTSVSRAEYEAFSGMKRVRPKGISPMIGYITDLFRALR
jgi:hypothetical protein